MAAHLTKPVSQPELFEAISRVLVTPEPQPDSAAAVTGQTVAKPTRKLRVLLAEDNAVNQKIASRVLEKHGHHVTLARDGREALALLDRALFDAVLMDVQMPEMDGFETTAAIRAGAGLARTAGLTASVSSMSTTPPALPRRPCRLRQPRRPSLSLA